MNIRVLIVLFLGLFSIATLLVYPPWKAHGEYAGHHRVDQVAWMEPDHTRLYAELGIVVLIMGILTVKLWGKKENYR
jgi:hypothetical protein